MLSAPVSIPRGHAVPLSLAEKRKLVMQARHAWETMKRAGAIDEPFDDFRRRIAVQACGRSISQAIRADWHAISTAFLIAAGQTKRAIHVAERGETEPQRIALHKLREALAEAGLNEAYAATICQRQYRCGLAEASVKQIWSLFYTIRNRGKSKARKAQAAPPAPALVLSADDTAAPPRKKQSLEYIAHIPVDDIADDDLPF